MGVMIDLDCASYAKPPDAVTFDNDDTVDLVHGHQQLSRFNAHHDDRCFLPIHVYDTATSRPVAVLLRSGKTPSGNEIPRSLPPARPSHSSALATDPYHHPGATGITAARRSIECCDENGVDFIFGLPDNAVLDRAVDDIAGDIRTRRALDQKPCLRGFAGTSYRAKSWNTDRRACARIEATTKGLDTRFVVTSIKTGSAEHIDEMLYCARGPGRKPDQTSQGPARLRPHHLPQPAREPDAPDPAYCRLLAHAHRPRRHSPDTCARHRRVQHHPPAGFEARSASYRDGIAPAACLCRWLPGRHFDPRYRGGADVSRTVDDGAVIAAVSTSRKPLAATRRTRCSGDTDATRDRALSDRAQIGASRLPAS
jgi:hypothetical protein